MINAIGLISSSIEVVTNERLISYIQASFLYGVEAYIYPITEIKSYLEKGYINAFCWQDGEIQQCRTDIPVFSEFHGSTVLLKKNHPEEYNWLETNTRLTDAFGLFKVQFQEILLKSSFSSYAIPTFTANTYPELCMLLKAIPNAIVKPSGGTKGLGIMRLTRANGEIQYVTHDSTGEFTQTAFDNYFKALPSHRVSSLLLEPCLNIRNNAGKAVDFRCLVSLNGKGEWENVITYARIGASSVASNISDGGAFNLAIDVLKQFLPTQAGEKLAEMNRVALGVAELIQKNAANPVSWLGIDICLDRDSNQLYVIEANSKPGTKFVGSWQLALVRAQYFKYLLQNNS